MQITGKGEAGSLAAPADWHKLLTADARTALPAEFVARMDELRLMPLYELLEELFTLFDMGRIGKQDAYLVLFLRCGDRVPAKTTHPTSTVSSATGTRRFATKPFPAEKWTAYASSPIHKSKGLEFHTVLIPFCDWKLENETYNQLVGAPPPKRRTMP